jgi:xanthine dehydrogenase YagR molybdenum-binding subunit
MADTGIGANAQRVDGREKVMGRPLYGADRLPARTVFAVPVAATVGKAHIVTIDTAVAERVQGVLAIFTYRNMDRLKRIEFSFAGGQGIQSHMPMQAPEVLYRGECIALAVAETLEAAEEAASLVRANYEERPFAVQLDGNGGTEVGQAKAAPYFPDFVKGDPAPLIDAAPVSVDAVYHSAAQHHNPMEMLSTVAEWRDGSLIVHEGTQAAQAMKVGLVIAFGLPEDKVRVISPYIGGAFGQRGSISPHTVLAALAARRVGRPVKLTVPRAQIFHATSFRAATEHHIRIGADHGGRFVGGMHLVRSQTSRFDLMPYTGEETTSRAYGWPAFRGATTLVQLDTQTPGFMRAPMEMASFFALESAVDELAEKLAMDPVELRILNDTKTDPISGKPFSSRNLVRCLRRGAERFGWSQRSRTPRSMRLDDGTLVGWGVAAGAYPAYITPAIARIRLHADGRVDLSVGAHEMGQGIRSAIAAVAEEELGVPADKLRILIGDTIVPPQHVTSGAAGAATVSIPISKASLLLREVLAKLAAKSGRTTFIGADPTTTRVRGGRLQLPGGESESVANIMASAGVDYVDGIANGAAPGMTPDAFTQAALGKVAFFGPEFPGHVSFSYIAHFVEVRIDPLVPRPRVTRMVSVADCGRVLSRRTAESQLLGGLVWGIGAALTEMSEFDPRFGGFLNNNIAEYQIAVNADVRSLEVELLDTPDLTFSEIGAKGVGEVACVGAAGAIANAICHATGKRIRHLPIHVEDLI